MTNPLTLSLDTQKTILARALAGDVDGAVLQLADCCDCDLDAAHETVMAWLRTAPTQAPVQAPDAVEGVPLAGDAVDALFGSRVWDENLVAEELTNIASEVWHRIVYGGHLLRWARRRLGDLQFQSFIAVKVGIGRSTAYKWMQAAELAEHHPRLAAPMGRAGLKKALLLTAMPPELVSSLEAAMETPESAAAMESLFDRPYVDLKRELEDARRQLQSAAARVEDEASRAAKAERTVAELVRTPSNPAQETIDVLRKHKNSIHSAVIAHLGTAELLCRDWDSADPAVKAEVLSLMEWLDALGRFEHARMRLLVGDENWGDTYRAIIAEGRVKTDSVYDLDESRILPFFGGAAGDDGKARKGPRT